MNHRTNLFIDIAILVAFLVAMEPGLTGIPIHEWLSLAFGLTILVHLLLHWKWIVGVVGRFFKQFLHVSRLQFVIDVLLFVSFILVMLSGLVISRSVLSLLNIRLSGGMIWRQIHTLSADATLYLAGLHFALNWNWVVTMLKRYVASPLFSVLRRREEKPQPLAEIVEHS